jgi:hypothetical protein
MKPLTAAQQKFHNEATTCITCHKQFTSNNHKTRHHSHVTGSYIGPACNNCNLQLKPRHVSTKSDKSFVVPVCAHNMRGYDGHLILSHLELFAVKSHKKSKGTAILNLLHKIPSDTFPLNSTVFASLTASSSYLLLLTNLSLIWLSMDTKNLYTYAVG